MLFKRGMAVVMAMALLLGLVACAPVPSTESSNTVDSQYQSTVEEETPIGDTVTSAAQDTEAPGTDSSEGETSTNDDTLTSSTQDTDQSSQDTGEAPPTEDTTTVCNHGDEDPYKGMSKAEFYADYTTACCNQDATYRSKHGFLSGSLEIPGQYAVEDKERPKSNGKFVRNIANLYLDNGNTYIVMDADGVEVMRIHKAGGYITLEEVAAYMYAFGGSGKIPANYVSKKSVKPNSSIWGEYLRVNHSYFKGDTNKYPYEPELPNISGCGGSLQYYEMDIGTTGTATPGYAAKPYIQGNKINRGAARIVYARQDLNGNGVYENNEVYVFYTHNHYNDFREYLNYYGGWGEMFGNVTGGGEYSSETKYNPTPYVPTDYADFAQ